MDLGFYEAIKNIKLEGKREREGESIGWEKWRDEGLGGGVTGEHTFEAPNAQQKCKNRRNSRNWIHEIKFDNRKGPIFIQKELLASQKVAIGM